MTMSRKFELISTAPANSKLPQRSTSKSGGYDFFYNNEEPTIIGPHEIKYVPTQVKAQFPERRNLRPIQSFIKSKEEKPHSN